MSTLRTATRLLVAAAVLGAAARAHAQPIELKDQNGTSYFINTAVDPLVRNSEASGAIANATYDKSVTVTSYFVGLTPFGFFLTTYSVQRQVDVPLRNAFAGFNGLVISGLGGESPTRTDGVQPGRGPCGRGLQPERQESRADLPDPELRERGPGGHPQGVRAGQLGLRPVAEHRDQHRYDATPGGHHVAGSARLRDADQDRHHLERGQRRSPRATCGSPAVRPSHKASSRPSPPSASSCRALVRRRPRSPRVSTAAVRRSSPTIRRSPPAAPPSS